MTLSYWRRWPHSVLSCRSPSSVTQDRGCKCDPNGDKSVFRQVRFHRLNNHRSSTYRCYDASSDEMQLRLHDVANTEPNSGRMTKLKPYPEMESAGMEEQYTVIFCFLRPKAKKAFALINHSIQASAVTQDNFDHLGFHINEWSLSTPRRMHTLKVINIKIGISYNIHNLDDCAKFY
jgi:hypothetical protein